MGLGSKTVRLSEQSGLFDRGRFEGEEQLIDKLFVRQQKPKDGAASRLAPFLLGADRARLADVTQLRVLGTLCDMLRRPSTQRASRDQTMAP